MLGNSRKLRRLNTHRFRQHSNSSDWDNRKLDTDDFMKQIWRTTKPVLAPRTHHPPHPGECSLLAAVQEIFTKLTTSWNWPVHGRSDDSQHSTCSPDPNPKSDQHLECFDSAIGVGDRRDAALHFALKEAQKTQEDLAFPEGVEWDWLLN